MSENAVYVKRYPASTPQLCRVDEQEIWRYAGYRGGPGPSEGALRDLLTEVVQECLPLFRYDVCYRIFPLSWEETSGDGSFGPGASGDGSFGPGTSGDGSFGPGAVGDGNASSGPGTLRDGSPSQSRTREERLKCMPILPFASTSKGLAKCLAGSTQVVMMAATVGIGPDRMAARYERTHPAKALLLQAFGAERVEALCDHFCSQIACEQAQAGRRITARFSPGYSDLPLETQRDFVRILDCSRQIGVTLGEGLLMSPTKSVTAIFGIRAGQETGGNEACREDMVGRSGDETGREGIYRRGASCRTCTARNCAYRIGSNYREE